jgi:hypothetical protein
MAKYFLRMFWIGYLISPLASNSQTAEKKNTLNFGVSFLNFKDGYGFLTTQYIGLKLKETGYYLEYERKISRSYSLTAGLGQFYYFNYPALRGDTDVLSQSSKYDLLARNMRYYNLGVKRTFRPIINQKYRLDLGLIFAITYQRMDNAFFLNAFPSGFDAQLAGASGNRFGISPGINGSITILNHLNLGVNFMFTQFFTDITDQYPGDWVDYTAPKNYFIITPTIGVKF